MSRKPEKTKAEVGTTGHSWDGIEELNNPLPRWWLWVLYATIVWGIGYAIAYPAWPMISRATPGLLGHSTRGDVAAEIAAVNARNAGLHDELGAADLDALLADKSAPVYSYAVNMGRSVFLANCSQCHGAGAAGVQASGYPSLIDDDWLWGGTIQDIAHTVTDGIRNEQSPDSRWVEMPAFGGMLSRDEISGVVQHVRAISGQEHDAGQAAAGAEVFAANCASCHGEAGQGDRAQGAPRLNDAIWLYGGSVAAITETVRNARFGVMPAWGQDWRGATGLDQAQINAVSAYVHQLGGGE